MIKKTMLIEFFYMNKTNDNAKELNLLYQEFPQYFVWSSTDKFWALRKQRSAIGRIITCHPTEEERYYLRLLLAHVQGPTSYKNFRIVNEEPCNTFRKAVQGPTSYKNFRIVNEEPCNTFRKAVEKRGFLYSNNSLIECMSEVETYQMLYSLRHLFATLLVFCNPTNPRELWEQFEESMSEDYKLLQNTRKKEIRYQVLNHINDILHSMSHTVNEYQLIQETIRPSMAAKDAKEIHLKEL
ncbi:hypothetical protein T459_30652 [Capsicum annuum]|uniref:Helitron helicase-like domain-containing protein n=1 Tax=Capsicum annuum TaxID=4072 RepID=A0A2G2Y8Z3_CAPAN|nr:hypothetical protein T459_30652 [Capsicum annuum]